MILGVFLSVRTLNVFHAEVAMRLPELAVGYLELCTKLSVPSVKALERVQYISGNLERMHSAGGRSTLKILWLVGVHTA